MRPPSRFALWLGSLIWALGTSPGFIQIYAATQKAWLRYRILRLERENRLRKWARWRSRNGTGGPSSLPYKGFFFLASGWLLLFAGHHLPAGLLLAGAVLCFLADYEASRFDLLT